MGDSDHQSQVESWLGRPLIADELVPAPSLERLSPAQLAVVEAIAPRDAFSAMLYLRILVANVLVRDLKPFVDEILTRRRRATR
jgi:hypothetical protein